MVTNWTNYSLKISLLTILLRLMYVVERGESWAGWRDLGRRMELEYREQSDKLSCGGEMTEGF